MAGDPVAEFCRKAHIDQDELSDAEIRLLLDLSQAELDALVEINRKGKRVRPVARVGSSGF
jgi:hypothetical protein